MKIVADQNIPALEPHFGHLGELVLSEGRAITPQLIRDADVLLVRSVTTVDAALLEDSAVRFVGSATAGVDHIRQEDLAALGIGFAHAPGSNAQSVVEYVLAALCHHGGALRRVLNGAPVGIVGFGHVGRRLSEVLDSLSIKYRVFDPWLAASACQVETLDEVLDCPVISLHCELTDQEPWPSVHLLDASMLSRIAPGTLLINASRGAVIDNQALFKRLKSSPDIDVVLDVWEHEPLIDPGLLALCLLGTAHIAGYSLDAKQKATMTLSAALCEHLELAESELPQSEAFQREVDPRQAIALSDSISVEQALRHLVQARYDIAADDQQLRRTVEASTPDEQGAAFDRLRKEYPVRREIAGSTVHYDGDDLRITHMLAALGCAG